MTLSEQLAERVDHALTRRQFLTKLGGAILRTIGIFLAHRPAAAYSPAYIEKCCNLCYPPGSIQNLPSCPEGSTTTAHAKWCWFCTHTDGNTYRCCEAKRPNSLCGRNCDGVYASWIEFAGRFAPEF